MQARQQLGLRIILFILTAFFVGAFASAGIAQEEEPPVEEENPPDVPEHKNRQDNPYDNERGDDTWFRDGYYYGILKDERNGISQEWRGAGETYTGGREGGSAEGDLFYDFYDEPSEGLLDSDELSPAPLPEFQMEQPERPETKTEEAQDKPSTEPRDGSAAEDRQSPL